MRRAVPREQISQVPYLPGIDGLRALAVSAVVVYHANSSWLHGGFLGVEVFLVISGYLITLLLIAEDERTGLVDLKNFWLRRARRLLPALFLLLIGLAVYTSLFYNRARASTRGDYIAALAYVSNWFQVWVGAGYTAAEAFAPLRHLWSLAVEEQFYLLWPLLFGLGHLYEWANAEHVAHDALLQAKAPYLNVPFFVIRVVLYFAVWLVVAYYLVRWSREQDATGDPDMVRRLQFLGRGALLLYSLTMTFAAVDWAMSLEPHWYSTIYGILIIGGQVLSAFAFVTAVLVLLADRAPLNAYVTPDQFHDLGKLMLAFVMLYAYFAFSQFLIIWSGNLPEDTPWYLNRSSGGWQYVAVLVLVLQFVVPFVVLLSRDIKRRPNRLAVVALIVLGARLLDLFWLVKPAFSPGQFSVHWMDIAAVFGIGGLWLSFFVWQLRDQPLLPLRDPQLLVEPHA